MLPLSQKAQALLDLTCKFFFGEDRPDETFDAKAAFEPVRQRPEISHIPLNFDAEWSRARGEASADRESSRARVAVIARGTQVPVRVRGFDRVRPLRPVGRWFSLSEEI